MKAKIFRRDIYCFAYIFNIIIQKILKNIIKGDYTLFDNRNIYAKDKENEELPEDISSKLIFFKYKYFINY